ncbi:membrane protein G74 [Vespertilionid gammaherpesvirus 1]|uniref:Membrane protein G74 n=1 Tax=Vespertilionid gammaherpesvirus 1 TaxID=2560830 RepID=A0A0X9Y7J7_9GAMA|nr:membrane protein G74 [Myotis gammaherpesvirus 8]AMA67429.1 membrane protein G74 [Vespertilionid gammaherpesvirus 1]
MYNGIVIDFDQFNWSDIFPNDTYEDYEYNVTYVESICSNGILISRSLYMIVLGVCLVLCLFGNVSFLYKLCFGPINKTCHILLLSMGINSFLACAYMCLKLCFLNGIHTTILCKVMALCYNVFGLGNVFFVCLLCIDTWFAIWFPACTPIKTVRGGAILCLITCTASILLSLPDAVNYSDLKISETTFACALDVGANTVYAKFQLSLFEYILKFFLPIVILIVFYGMCVYRLCTSKFKARLKAMRTILLLVCAFLICWVPFYVGKFLSTMLSLNAIEDSCYRRGAIDTIIMVSKILGLCQCFLQSMVYIFSTRRVRRRFSCSR